MQKDIISICRNVALSWAYGIIYCSSKATYICLDSLKVTVSVRALSLMCQSFSLPPHSQQVLTGAGLCPHLEETPGGFTWRQLSLPCWSPYWSSWTSKLLPWSSTGRSTCWRWIRNLSNKTCFFLGQVVHFDPVEESLYVSEAVEGWESFLLCSGTSDGRSASKNMAKM